MNSGNLIRYMRIQELFEQVICKTIFKEINPPAARKMPYINKNKQHFAAMDTMHDYKT